MIKNKKIIVVLPAYNASSTLTKTYHEIPFDIVDDIVLVDDNSDDNTVRVATELGIKHIVKHQSNKGYGAKKHIEGIKKHGITPMHRKTFGICKNY